MFGYGITYSEGKVIFFEQLRIEVSNDSLTYFAYPNGVGPTTFTAVIHDEHSISFENIDNDYPQRISYSIDAAELSAKISLVDGSKPQIWRMVSCDDE